MIPGKTYYWKANSTDSVFGFVKATGDLRMIKAPGMVNMRDLGGWPVTLSNGSVGKIKYGKLFRGAHIYLTSSNDPEMTSYKYYLGF